MNDDNDPLARLLGDAFEAQARGAVGDHARPPAPRFLDSPAAPAQRPRATRIWAPLAAAAAVVAIVAGVLGVSGAFDGHDKTPAADGRTSTAAPSTPAAVGVPADANAAPVHIRTTIADGATYGVGMPVVAYFSKKITDGRSLQEATTATVNGKPVRGAWYFENSSADKNYPIEGHFRPDGYWTAHSQVRVTIAAKGLSAGRALGFDNDVTLGFAVGAAQILTVDNSTHRLTFTRDGKKLASYPVSLGAANTLTSRGIKVIMDKGLSISMRGPGYYDPSVKYTQRLTYGGEYLHSAPWNEQNIDNGVNSSNGCTNLLPADAKKLYAATRVGDVVTYPNADGPAMQFGQGLGDWNVPWTKWLTGGLVPTR